MITQKTFDNNQLWSTFGLTLTRRPAQRWGQRPAQRPVQQAPNTSRTAPSVAPSSSDNASISSSSGASPAKPDAEQNSAGAASLTLASSSAAAARTALGAAAHIAPVTSHAAPSVASSSSNSVTIPSSSSAPPAEPDTEQNGAGVAPRAAEHRAHPEAGAGRSSHSWSCNNSLLAAQASRRVGEQGRLASSRVSSKHGVCLSVSTPITAGAASALAKSLPAAVTAPTAAAWQHWQQT